jgi:hypothetical protein
VKATLGTVTIMILTTMTMTSVVVTTMMMADNRKHTLTGVHGENGATLLMQTPRLRFDLQNGVGLDARCACVSRGFGRS